MPDSTRNATLKYIVESKGFDTLDKGFAQLNRNSDLARARGLALAETYKKTGGALDAAFSSASFKQQERDWQRALDNADRFVKELDAADKAAEKLNAELKQTGFLTADTKGKLGTIRQENRAESFAAGTVASLLPGDIGNVSRELFDLVDTIPDLGVALSVLKASILDTVAVLGGGSLATGGALIGGLALLGGVFLLLKRNADLSREAVEKEVLAREAFNKIIATGTQASITDQLKVNELKQIEARLNLESAQKAADAALAAFNDRPFLSDNSDLVAAYQAQGVAVNQALEAINLLTREEINLRVARENELVILRSMTAAQDAFVNENIRVLQAAQGMTGEQANARLDAINKEIAAIERFNNTAGQSEENQAILQKRLDALTLEGSLLQTLIPTVIAHNDQLAYEIKQRQEIIDATKKYNDDIARVEEQSQAARQAAHEKYLDRVEAIAEQAAQAAANALQKLEAQRAKLDLDLARGAEDATIKAQRDRVDESIKLARDEAKAARLYADEVKKINRQSRSDSLKFIADRDVVGLIASRENAKSQLADAKSKLDSEARERAIANEQSLADQQTQYAREAEDRQRAYDRALSDAQVAYDEELRGIADKNAKAQQANDAAHNKELSKLDIKLIAQRQKLEAAFEAELAIITSGYAQRAAVVAAGEAALLAQTQPVTGSQSARSLLDGAPLTPLPSSSPLPPMSSGPGFSARSAETSRNSGGAGGGNVASIMFSLGASGRQIELKSREAAHRALDRVLKEAGF